ncbi:hypothetical protein HPP92_023208 [Vanilla planifolia]|uniref:Uncharacterized protein n=1 Tax=Vanilla planifolia TaxID=51239 RepID=A0A835PWU1_VANPL|nr:hypothetical protein HPP92_023517 [Vanilla planifolia]KAG0460080.1 hypothetical protein HPP92_023208 [Vanilla planifolia]
MAAAFGTGLIECAQGMNQARFKLLLLVLAYMPSKACCNGAKFGRYVFLSGNPSGVPV